MRILPLGLLLLLAYPGESWSQPADQSKPPSKTPPVGSTPAATTPAAPAAALRCLPVVAAKCGCVYTCGVGAAQPDGTYRIIHGFWKDEALQSTPLTGRIDRWCVHKQCTDAFVVAIPCDGICMPKPADPTCHFVGTSCVSSRKEP